MSLLQSVLLGLIQGLTEFLPVSSSGHLAIFKQFFQIETGGMFFDILLHIGTPVSYTHLDVYKRQILWSVYYDYQTRRYLLCGFKTGSRLGTGRNQTGSDYTE